jgi:hypothetical protein
MNCEHCQSLLLDDLYDLLDPDERSAVHAHLEGCPACRQAKAALADGQLLLAQAARESFAGVSFQPPAETPSRLAEPIQSLPMRRRQRGFSWVRVAVAASIVVIVLGGSSLGVIGWLDHKDEIALAENKLQEAAASIARQHIELEKHHQVTQAEIQAIQADVNRLFEDWKRDAVKTRHEQEKQLFQVKLQGPRGTQAGAAFPLQLDIIANSADPVANRKNNTYQAQVNVRDRVSNQLLYQQNVANNREGSNYIPLPQSIPVNPNQDLAVEVLVQNDYGKPVKLREELNLTASEYLTHLSTDRPMYRPGELVRFRSLTLERFSLKPVQEDLHLQFKLTGPNNQELFKAEGANQIVTGSDEKPIQGPDGKSLRGLGVGEIPLAPDLPGGTYTLTVSEAKERFAPERRTFLVNQWQQPRMNKELVFSRSSYGPGDIVEVQAKAVRVEGGAPLAQHPVQARAMVDGKAVAIVPMQTDEQGKVRFTFTLPPAQNIPRGQGTVAIEFNDGAGPETIVRSIPIVLKKLHVEFFPEGGDLIQGVSNRLYFQARTTLGKAAELKGKIVDQTGAEVAQLATFHDDQEPAINQGQGAFTFTPQMGKRYELKIDAPIGIEGKYPLPAAKPEGVVLHLSKPVAEHVLEAEVTSADRARQLLVGVYCRGKLLDQRILVAPAGKTVPVTLRTAPGISGVYRVTVFEMVKRQDGPGLLPRAERLTFRKGAEKLDVAVKGLGAERVPGENVKLGLQAWNEKKQPTPAILLVSVVDLSVLKLADEKTARSLPTHFLLTSEIRRPEDLENADALLGSHPKAETALDLLLGTQGWRRFAEQRPQEFQQQEPREAQRLLQPLALHDQKRDPVTEIVAEKVDKQYVAKATELMVKLADKEAIEAGTPDALQELQIAQGSQEAEQARLTLAEGRLRNYARVLLQFAIGVIVCAALLCGIGAVVLGVRRMGQGRSPLAAFATGTCLLMLLFMASLAGTGYLIGSKGELPGVLRPGWEAEAKDAPAVAMAPPQMQVVPLAAEEKDQLLAGLNEPLQQGVPMDDAAVKDIMLKMPGRMAAAAPMAMPGMGPMAARPGAPMQAAAEGQFGGGIQFMPGQQQAMGMMIPQGQVGDLERELRLQRRYSEIFRQRLGRPIDLPAELPTFVVREYAHKHAPAEDSVRRDFTETLFWHPVLVLPDGKGEIAFDLSDATTRFQVSVLSHSLDGRLGANTFEIASRLPFSVDPKVPFEIGNNDIVMLPVAIKNDTDGLGNVDLALRLKGLKTQDALSRNITLTPKERTRVYFNLEPTLVQGKAQIIARGEFHLRPFGIDSVERGFTIVPDGFPVQGGISGMLEKAAAPSLQLPDAWLPGTLECKVQVFPTVLGTLQKGLDALLQEPNGCFEQSSSSNYPNVLILNYLQETSLASPDAEKRARQLLQSGYQKLTSFECIDPKRPDVRRGYEWFGQTAPPHEALTAYGLLQFRDMAKVHPVDEAMLERTRKYLLGQRDGKGGFKRNPQAIDSFGRAPDHITSAYIVWALTESGVSEDLSAELAALGKQAQTSKDPYFLALVGLSHVNRGQSKDGVEILKKLRDLQKPDGHLQAAQTSITGSQGRDLELETTALAVLGWLKANRPEEFFKNVHQAVEWISKQRSGQGSFGATQSTILALKALIAFTRDHKETAEAGKLTVSVAGNEIGATTFSASVAEPITLAIPEGLLKPGANKVVVEISGKNVFPYTLGWSCRTLQPASAKDSPVELTAKLSQAEAREGDTVKLFAAVENKTGKGQGMTVAILGLPGGLALPEDAKQLVEMAKLREDGARPGPISAWELRGRELVLYWRELAPGAKIDLELDLVCRLPGSYRGPASRAYLYYHADHKHWIEPLAISIFVQRE